MVSASDVCGPHKKMLIRSNNSLARSLISLCASLLLPFGDPSISSPSVFS